MSQLISLEFHERRRLVGALLTCSCMRNALSRDQALADLPVDVRSRINRFPNDQADVDSIVRACLSFSGALERLLEIVHYHEGGSLSARLLEQVVSEIRSKPAAPDQASAPVAHHPPEIAGVTPDPRAQPSQHLLLPYLCNRSAQEEKLKKRWREHHANRPRRPFLAVIHGDEYECHDMFIERLLTEALPGLLNLNVSMEPFYWYESPSPKAAAGQFWQSLGDKCLGHPYEPVEALRKLVLKKLEDSGRPLFVNIGWLTENCEPCDAKLFDSFLQFLEEWPELPANKVVICGLSLTYQRSKSSASRFGFWQKSPNDKLRGLVERLKVKSSDKFTLAVLPELHAVTRKEAEDWPSHPKVRSQRQINKDVITKLYRQSEDRPIAMEELAQKLQELLSGNPQPRN
jgi:hypothetical protein